MEEAIAFEVLEQLLRGLGLRLLFLNGFERLHRFLALFECLLAVCIAN